MIKTPTWRIPFPKTRLLYVYLVSISAIVIVSLMWYLMNDVTVKMADIILAQHSEHIDSDIHTFLTNFWYWFPIMFMFGLLVFVYIYSQRPKGYGYG